MANNDKLEQIISNLQILSDLTKSMIDTEIYPVSFFSQAFDLTQKVQSDIQDIESNQVDMFAVQMKKHQELILSIHQQMRNISTNTQTQKPVSSDTNIKPTVNKTVTPPQAKTSEQKEEKPKKVSILDRIEVTSPPPKPIESNTEANSTKPVREKKAAEPTTNAIKSKTIEGKSTITIPVTAPAMKIIHPEKKRLIGDPVTTEGNVKPTNNTNSVVEKRKLSDLRKAFSLNDRFRYRRELFGGSEDSMNKAIAILNEKDSIKDSIQFLEEKLRWDFSSPTVKDFIKLLELRFL